MKFCNIITEFAIDRIYPVNGYIVAQSRREREGWDGNAKRKLRYGEARHDFRLHETRMRAEWLSHQNRDIFIVYESTPQPVSNTCTRLIPAKRSPPPLVSIYISAVSIFSLPPPSFPSPAAPLFSSFAIKLALAFSRRSNYFLCVSTILPPSTPPVRHPPSLFWNAHYNISIHWRKRNSSFRVEACRNSWNPPPYRAGVINIIKCVTRSVNTFAWRVPFVLVTVFSRMVIPFHR